MSRGSVFDDDASRKLEAAYLTPDVVAQRRETLQALALQPGEWVLDIGSGPGLLVAEMAELVGQSGRVTGLEISDSMLALGRRRCADPSIRELVAFVKADAAALPFPDDTFDVAVSTQVYEYVADLKGAFAELHRVLRPGGRALIIDTDWDSIVWNATHPERMQRLLTAWTKRFADPHLPARSPGNFRMPGCRCDTATS
jgi:arsenite methyltransferase